MHNIQEHNVLFLLGAGASKEAGIKISSDMVDDIEKFIINKPEWTIYKLLYYYLRSSIEYSEGLHGNFTHKFNIEDLLNVMSELEKREKNTVYPFIGNWNNKLLEVAKQDFSLLTEFNKEIREQLFHWINIKNYKPDAEYYSSFARFKNELGFAIRIFTLNYDLCFEQIINNTHNIEMGFDNDNIWKYSNFDYNPDSDIDFYLYKLHGSINWEKDSISGRIKKCDTPQMSSEIIFGTDTKLQSIDPYLFYVFEFRRWTLDTNCKLIVAIGYSFSDVYINNLISQSLRHDDKRKLLVVNPCSESEKIRIKGVIGLEDDRIIFEAMKAKEFLLEKLNVDYIDSNIYKSIDTPFGE